MTTDLYLPALPLLRIGLGASLAAAQLTMSAVLLCFGIGQLAMGPLSDRFGRRPVLLCGLALYSLASIGASLAPDIAVLIACRALQGIGLAASVVCARAMLRDLYEPHEGAHVMSRALTGLGILAVCSPLVGGLLATYVGWRAALAAVAVTGTATLVYVWRRLPETLALEDLHALAPGPLLATAREISAHPAFRAWTALISATYGGLFMLLAGTPFVYMSHFGLPSWQYGALFSFGSACYVAGTISCRRLIPRLGLAGTVKRGAYFTLAGGLLMVSGGLELWPASVPTIVPVLAGHWIYAYAHGIHQPVGQAASVGAFPRAAGVASALSGFVLATTAFAVGLWLGAWLDGSLRTLSLGLGTFALITTIVAWTLVQRNGRALDASPAQRPT